MGLVQQDIISEMGHNEIIGLRWDGASNQFAVDFISSFITKLQVTYCVG